MVKGLLKSGKGVNLDATGMPHPKQPESRRIDCGKGGERRVCGTDQHIVTRGRMTAIAAKRSNALES